MDRAEITVRFKFSLALRRAVAMFFMTISRLLGSFSGLLRGDVPLSVVKSWHRDMCRIGGISVEIKGEIERGDHILYVSNHVSYIDIPVMGSFLDAWFVAKSEVRGWPGFGFLAKVGKTVFIERKTRRAHDQQNQLSVLLDQGKNLILFPEGTSTDGLDVVTFKPTLFQAAFDKAGKGDSRIRIQPFSIRYIALNDTILTAEMRDRYAWYGDMTLADHFWYWLGLGQLRVELCFHPAINPAEFKGRKEVAAHCENLIHHDLKSV